MAEDSEDNNKTKDSEDNNKSKKKDEDSHTPSLITPRMFIKAVIGIFVVLFLYVTGYIFPALVAGGIIILFIIFDKSQGKLSKFIKFFLTLSLVFVVVYYLVIPIASSWYASGFSGVIAEKGATTLSNLPIYKYFYTAYQSIKNPQKVLTGVSWDSEVEQNKEAQDLGIRILSFKPQYRSFDSKSPISLLATIKAKALEDSKLKVRCSLKDYKGSVESLISESNSDEAEIYKNIPTNLMAQCNFNDGLTTEKDILSKRATINVDYDFTTKAYLNIYTLSNAKRMENLKNEINPFENIQDPYIKSDRTLSSVTTASPMTLAIGFQQSQPLSPGITYPFGITIKNDMSWSGNINKLNKITIELPSNLELDASKKCDFIKSSELLTGAETLNSYELTMEAMKMINTDCSKYLSEDECLSQYKETNTFLCNLKVLNADDTTNYVGSIKAQANYIYTTKYSTTVNIVKPLEQANIA